MHGEWIIGLAVKARKLIRVISHVEEIYRGRCSRGSSRANKDDATKRRPSYLLLRSKAVPPIRPMAL
jgi:hypothetical protein